jgi:lysophospholipase L1-like esterase
MLARQRAVRGCGWLRSSLVPPLRAVVRMLSGRDWKAAPLAKLESSLGARHLCLDLPSPITEEGGTTMMARRCRLCSLPGSWIAPFRLAIGALLLAAPLQAAASPIQTYLALGDSITFGETNVTGSSFFTAVSPPGFAPHTVLDSVNLNYRSDPAQSQNSLMLATFAAEAAAGHAITHVSFALGLNDRGVFETQHPDFFTLSAAQQRRLVTAFFAVLTANYITTLAEIRAALPGAQILLLNSYNDATIFGPGDPFNIANQIFDAGQTAMIQGLEKPFDARLVDVHSAFQGHETAFTFVLQGDVHPTDAGYAAIAHQMVLARVPEPYGTATFVVGVLADAVRGATRRAALNCPRYRLKIGITETLPSVHLGYSE